MTKNKNTLIIGDLGRHPEKIASFFQTHYPQLEITVISKHYPFPPDPFDKVKIRTYLKESTDVLLILEPDFHSYFNDASHLASKIIVFSSHDILLYPETKQFHKVNFICPSEFTDAAAEVLVDRQDMSITHNNISAVKNQISEDNILIFSKNPEHADVLVVSGKPLPQLQEPNVYAILDLTLTSDVTDIFLTILDLFDVLKLNARYIRKWILCFPDIRAEKLYRQIVQKFVDKRICERDLEYLKVTPFISKIRYIPIEKINSIKHFDFFKYKIYSPLTYEEIGLLSAFQNVFHITNNMYLCKKYINA